MLTSVHFSVILLLVYKPDTERCSFLVRLARTYADSCVIKNNA
jgi:hypothetical protein